MIRSRNRVSGVVVVAFLTFVPAVEAGVNTWTGTPREYYFGPIYPPGPPRFSVATDPRDPYVVYAVFQPSLFKSRDGGRSWALLASFDYIHALLVHPAAPDTLYVGTTAGPELGGVWKSSDGGDTWAQKSSGWGGVVAIAGSPTNENTVFAARWPDLQSTLVKSTDGGDTWIDTSFEGVVASLVIPPREHQTVYVGMEVGYYFNSFVGLGRSSDEGSTWTITDAGLLDRVAAVAVDPEVPSRVYLGLTAFFPESEHGILRSEDGGATFVRVDHGLPTRASVTSLVIDPVNPETLYAGTDVGVYRSLDAGTNWSAIGQVLSGDAVASLAISPDGRRIHAGTPSGARHFDLVSGPVDIAATPGGGARVLRWNSDRLTVQTVDRSNNWTATPFSATSQTWIGIAIASAGDGTARVLWQNGDGRSALETVSGVVSVFGESPSGIPADVAVGADGSVRLLWINAAGAMHVRAIGADGSERQGPAYGPTPGWSAVAIDADAQVRSWVLWRSADGRAAVSLHVDGTLVTTVKWSATDGWWAEDLGVGSDGRARVLARNVAGAMQIWTVGEDGSRSIGATYESPGLVPRRIAAGADGLTRVLWGGEHGEGAVWFLDSAGNHVAVDVPVLP